MKADELRWDNRYSSKAYSDVPNKIVEQFYHIAQKGQALDIAAGSGRNTSFLAEVGYRVDAIDISSVGLHKIAEKNQRINRIHADLEFYELQPNQYDLVININFLQRRLFPQIIRSLKTGGILIFQTFMFNILEGEKNDTLKKGHLLFKNELLHEFLDLQIIYYEEKKAAPANEKEREIAILVAEKM